LTGAEDRGEPGGRMQVKGENEGRVGRDFEELVEVEGLAETGFV